MYWKGYRGRVLDVDLAPGGCKERELTNREARDYIGGSGLNAKLLYDMTGADTDPLSSENPLIFGAGPLVGTAFPSSARSTATALSPLTGAFGDSNGGSFFGARLKMAGYDHIVIRGRAYAPSYLLIDEEGARLLGADDLWGTDTVACEDELRKRYRGSTVLSIGPAGENMVSYANILGNGNACSFSRTGMGAVMGSKKLKAIVISGRGEVPVYDESGLTRLSDSLKRTARRSIICRIFSRYGTPLVGYAYGLLKLMGEKNARQKIILRNVYRLAPYFFNRQCEWKPAGCWNCPLNCHKHFMIKDGKYGGERGTKYEVGYIGPLGMGLGIEGVREVLHLVNVCNRLGVDLMEFSGTMGLVMDLLDQGILSASDLGGERPTWGDVDAIERILHLTAGREGFGDIVADGVRKAGERIGGAAESYALHFKGMHFIYARNPLAMLAFSVSTRGGDHLKGYPFLATDPLRWSKLSEGCGATWRSFVLTSHQEKGGLVWWHENYKMLMDSLGICFFLAVTLGLGGKLDPGVMAEAYRLATGLEISEEGLMRSAERAYLLERAINARRGLSRRDDHFVKRPGKRAIGRKIDLEHPGMLDDYYRYRGLNADGRPRPEKLRELGLDSVAGEFERHDTGVESSSADGPALDPDKHERSVNRR